MPNTRGVRYQTVSKKRKFKFLSQEKINDLKKMKLKRRSEAKVKWAVNAYSEWRQARIDNSNYDQCLIDADLNNLSNITKQNLEESLCKFVPEVTKSRGEGPYPGKTLYQMIVELLFRNFCRLIILDGS